MHLHPTLPRTTNILKPALASSSKTPPAQRPGSPEAAAEIHAYIAARDLALAEAERNPSNLTLSRATIANDLVQNYTRPARGPYDTQCLPDAEARREQARCEAVARRIAELRRAAATRQHLAAA
jgi:hypothetical protein